jgi:hypothetical protein
MIEAQIHYGSTWHAWPMRLFQAMFLLASLMFVRGWFACLWFVFLAFFEWHIWQVVEAIADKDGVRIRRWIKWKDIGWLNISTPSRQSWAWYLAITVPKEKFWNRHLLLSRAGYSLKEIEMLDIEKRHIRDLREGSNTGRTN